MAEKEAETQLSRSFKDIGEARDYYSKHGRILYAAAEESLKACVSELEITNDSYVHALALTEWMFRSTIHRLRMLTGPYADGFVGTLKDAFRGMLDRIASWGDQEHCAHVIVMDGKPGAGGLLDELASEDGEPGPLKVHYAETPPDLWVPHFIVCDDNMLREEEPHKPLSDHSSVTDVRAKVYLNMPVKAEVYAARFDIKWADTG